jgi:hypothetical protein
MTRCTSESSGDRCTRLAPHEGMHHGDVFVWADPDAIQRAYADRVREEFYESEWLRRRRVRLAQRGRVAEKALS